MAFYTSLAAAIADDLLHYWPMDESEGAAVADIAGDWNGQVITNNDDLSSAEIAASIKSSLSDYGRDVGEYINGEFGFAMPVRLSPDPPGASVIYGLTVRIRFFLTSEFFSSLSAPGRYALFSFGDERPVWVEIRDSSLGFRYCTGYTTHEVGTRPFNIGEWNDLVITSDTNGSQAYLNGTEIYSSTSGSFAYKLYDEGNNVYGFLGARSDGGTDRYIGDSESDIIIQDVAIWDRRFTDTEVSDLWTAGFSERLADRPPVEVEFDATADFSADFVAFQDGYSGFNVTANFSASFDVFQDWTQALNSLLLQESYQMVITGQEDGLDDLVVKISNWQATNQSGGRRAYLQAVIPGAQQYIDDISARSNGSLVIRQGFRLPSGESQFSEIMRSDFDSLRYDRSGNRFTVTVSGRKLNETPASGTRTLKGIRTISVTDGNRRVRCDIDLFLRPGMTVIADTEEFTADYINYFVTTNDKFCEVSER